MWAVTCFVTRAEFRGRGVSRALAAAAVAHARSRGATAVEGYPLVVTPDRPASSNALFVGTVGVFASAGMREVSRPTDRRVVMRVDL